ncbi:MAG: nicotinate-nucleotide--dimethylbenzimidazole phosphoribosyltransferase [Gammaproteobacteria bacterium]
MHARGPPVGGALRRGRPAIDRVAITGFVADHGVVAEGVSAYPQVVIREMLRNFLSGGAAITALAPAMGARLEVVDVGSRSAPVAGWSWRAGPEPPILRHSRP